MNIKVKNKSLILLIFSCLIALATCTYATTAPINTGASLAPMLNKVMPAVVNVAVRGELPLVRLVIPDHKKQPRNINVKPKFEEVGSGVIINADKGYIITNAHVIKDAKVIIVTLNDGRRITAKVVGYDVPSDIGVLQINAKRLNAIDFGDSDKLKIGDFVSAIGNPFGLQQTVTSGIVSGLGRTNLGIEGFEDFIQTDAPINPGNSGGALVNMHGELIGINTAIITPKTAGGSVGIGLAIPSNMAKSVMEQLIKYGKVHRGVVGVLVQDVTPALAEAMSLPNTKGALISDVIPGTPAAKAGLKGKDVILKVMGKPIKSASQVRNTVSLIRIGSKVDFQVLRNNKVINLSAVIANPEDLQKAQASAGKPLLSGLELKDFNQLVDTQHVKGVEVLLVDDNSIAYSCGVRPKDIIVSAAGEPVSNIDQLRAIAEKHQEQLLLEVKRGMRGKLFLVLER